MTQSFVICCEKAFVVEQVKSTGFDFETEIELGVKVNRERNRNQYSV